jgi:hypothetical protein
MLVGFRSLVLGVCAGGLLAAADAPPTFERTVQPVLTSTCSPCHNDQLASGGLDISAFAKPGSVAQNREGWEKIAQKIR